MANILAYFPSMDDAEEAAAELHSLGYEDLQIAQISEYPGDDIDRRFNPMTGRLSSLARLTLGANFSAEGDDAGPLLAADPGASGLAGGDDLDRPINFLLTVVLEDGQADAAREIIKRYGGLV